eukprot:scaffold17901_cov157-Cylindrotheca_fusiformis.AAC.2
MEEVWDSGLIQSQAPSHTTTNHGARLAGTNRTTDSERRQLAIFDSGEYGNWGTTQLLVVARVDEGDFGVAGTADSTVLATVVGMMSEGLANDYGCVRAGGTPDAEAGNQIIPNVGRRRG